MGLKRNYISLAGLGVVTLGLVSAAAFAADHNEAPGTMTDNAGDISDVYAWHTDDKLVAVVDFAGLAAAGSLGTYDPDMLYGVHIDNDGDNLPDVDIWVRFGQNANDEWGVQVVNLPGTDGPVEGPVDNVIDAGNGQLVYAGPREDPFFFDLDGFQATLMTGSIMFNNVNDTFAGLNVTAIVLEMDLESASAGNTDIKLWATSGRK